VSGPASNLTAVLDVEPLEDELTHLDREFRRAETRLQVAHDDHGPTAVRAAVLRGDMHRLAARRNQLAYAISRLTGVEAS
jgi:hypothetical protein